MDVGNRITSIAGIAVLLLNAAVAQAQTPPPVAFTDITDAVAGRFFDAEATSRLANDPANPNTLIISFNTGRDPATWKANDFRASSAAFSHVSAMDTISFRIVAPDGYYVSKVRYIQEGNGTIYRTGIVRGGSNWVVGDYAGDLGTYATNPDLSGTVDLTELFLTVVPVSITTGVHAFSTPLLGSATLSITGARVVAEVQPLPAPQVEVEVEAEVEAEAGLELEPATAPSDEPAPDVPAVE